MVPGDREQHKGKALKNKDLELGFAGTMRKNSELSNPSHKMFKSNMPNPQGLGRAAPSGIWITHSPELNNVPRMTTVLK